MAGSLGLTRAWGRGRGGAEGGGAGEFHLEGFSFSLWCLHAAMQDASTQAQHSLRERPGQEGEPLAGKAHSPPSCWQTFPSSSHSHGVILTVISEIHCKSLGTTFIIIPGTLESQGPSSLQISGVPGPALGLPLRGSPKFRYFFQAPVGLYFPGVCVCACVCACVCVRVRVCACACVCVC